MKLSPIPDLKNGQPKVNCVGPDRDLNQLFLRIQKEIKYEYLRMNEAIHFLQK